MGRAEGLFHRGSSRSPHERSDMRDQDSRISARVRGRHPGYEHVTSCGVGS
jgi:hypothetical protein